MRQNLLTSGRSGSRKVNGSGQGRFVTLMDFPYWGIPPATPHFLKDTQPSKTVPPSGCQVFKWMNWQGAFHRETKVETNTRNQSRTSNKVDRNEFWLLTHVRVYSCSCFLLLCIAYGFPGPRQFPTSFWLDYLACWASNSCWLFTVCQVLLTPLILSWVFEGHDSLTLVLNLMGFRMTLEIDCGYI